MCGYHEGSAITMIFKKCAIENWVWRFEILYREILFGDPINTIYNFKMSVSYKVLLTFYVCLVFGT